MKNISGFVQPKIIFFNVSFVVVLSDPEEIAAEMNNQAVQHGFPSHPYYLLSENNTKAVISNAPKPIYNELKLRKYIPPKRINRNTTEFINYLLECIDLVQNSNPMGQPQFTDGKEFQLNQCHHNSSSLFKMIYHLKDRGYIPSTTKIKIVFGYISRKVPYGSQVGNLGIVNNSLWVHDWHIWNYVNDIIFDMTLFSHGNIHPPEGNTVSWGKAEDHVVTFPPKCLDYEGCIFSELNKFNEIVGTVIGFR